MITTKLTFDPTGWLEINYIYTINLPDVVIPETPEFLDKDGNVIIPAAPGRTEPGGTQSVVLQSTSYHPTQLELIQADCATHGVTLDGDDAEAVAEWIASYVPPARPAPTLEDFDAAMTAHLDSTARQRRYDNRITCMVRAGFPGPFQTEGIAFATWCDTCNAFAYSFMAEVVAGTQPMPATTDEFIGLLPPMVWPVAA